MTGFVGGDVEQLVALAKRVELQSRKFGEIAASSSVALMVAEWTGADIDRIRGEWNRQFKPAMQRMSANLAALAIELRKQGEQQFVASTAGASRPLSAREQRIYDAALKNPKTLQSLTQEEVAAFWSELSPAQKQVLMQKDSLTIGNLNGIPFEDRADANQITAARRLNESDLSSEESAYLQAVVNPPPGTDRIRLAVYDRENDRLVEMVGHATDTTTTYVTYVPGTDTSMDSLYRGDSQQIARYLTEKDPNTVVFVYKDGKFPADIIQARDRSFAVNNSARLSEFQHAVDLEATPQARTVAIGHSWGLADITYAEQKGAHYDEVISLSGAYMPPDWEPSTETEYSHYVYALDVLGDAQRTGVVGHSLPTTDSAFRQHVYADEADTKLVEDFVDKSRIPIIGPYAALKDSFEIVDRSFSNHERISSTDLGNRKVLEDVRRDVYAS